MSYNSDDYTSIPNWILGSIMFIGAIFGLGWFTLWANSPSSEHVHTVTSYASVYSMALCQEHTGLKSIYVDSGRYVPNMPYPAPINRVYRAECNDGVTMEFDSSK